MNDYEQKILDKKDRYQKLAEKARQEAEQKSLSANEDVRMLAGQPILIDHHSEKKHRKLLEKIDKRFEQSYENTKKAEYYDEKVKSVGTGGISQDDPEAMQKLKDKLKSLENYHATMVDHNKLMRKICGKSLKKSGQSQDALDECKSNLKHAIEETDDQIIIKRYRKPYILCCKRIMV